MKNSTQLIVLALSLTLLTFPSSAQNVGINSIGATPNISALLDIDAAPLNNKGLLIPRVALTAVTDAVTISTPAISLTVYNTNAAMTNGNGVGYYYWSGTKWISIPAPANGPGVSGQVLTSQGAGTQPNWVLPCSNAAVPSAQWPTFDATSPYVLLGALWVGYDAVAGCWKYNKQAAGRGLTDPGNPTTWAVNGTTIDFFNGKLNKLPAGTHINNRYDPSTMAAKYTQDDIMVKVGSFWIDKYESRIIDVSTGIFQDNDNNTLLTPPDNDIRGNGQGIPPTWMAFSQKALGSSGMSWFVAQKASANAGKKLASNAEWQAAATGTARTDATGMTVGGETWSTVANQDVSQFGVVGMVGSLWERVGDWGQYGADQAGFIQGEIDANWGAAYNGDRTWNINGSAYSRASGGWTNNIPVGLLRGGAWYYGAEAGVFAVDANDAPSTWGWGLGFRSVRQ